MLASLAASARQCISSAARAIRSSVCTAACGERAPAEWAISATPRLGERVLSAPGQSDLNRRHTSTECRLPGVERAINRPLGHAVCGPAVCVHLAESSRGTRLCLQSSTRLMWPRGKSNVHNIPSVLICLEQLACVEHADRWSNCWHRSKLFNIIITFQPVASVQLCACLAWAPKMVCVAHQHVAPRRGLGPRRHSQTSRKMIGHNHNNRERSRLGLEQGGGRNVSGVPQGCPPRQCHGRPSPRCKFAGHRRNRMYVGNP